MPTLRAPRQRKGVYAILLALVLLTVLGFGAISIDLSYVRLAQSQTQDIADAASQAALITLRRTGDVDLAEDAARAVVAHNRVGNGTPTLDRITFGAWDSRAMPPTFTVDRVNPNAVQVEVGRVGENSLQLYLGALMGTPEVSVAREATSAVGNLHMVLVIDITNSWTPANFAKARQAALSFLDVLESSYGNRDKIGMTIFTGRYAWEYTPLTLISNRTAMATVRSNWNLLNKASKAGTPRTYPQDCNVYSGANLDNFLSPSGGCFPAMPREYSDEPGTDHTTGLNQAIQMFQEQPEAASFRGMVVLTDGIPNGISSGHGTIRQTTKPFTETRWRQYRGPAPHSTTAIQTESNTLTQQAWTNLGVNTWVVSFVQDGAFMHTMPKGIGNYYLTNTASELVPIFEDIANSLPLALVE